MPEPLRLLLVEDSEDDALLLLEALRAGGFDPRCRRVETEAAFRAALAEGAWDVIITDYVLPRFCGLEAVLIARELGRDIPIIMVSGKVGEETAVEAMRAGAGDYILKDRLSARLAPVVERELREARGRRERRQAEQQCQLLIFTMQQGVVYQDADGAILSMNPAAVRILGKMPEGFLDEASASVEHDTIREDGTPFPGREHPAIVALRSGEMVRDVVMGVYNPRERQYRWINITAVPLFREGETTPNQVYTIFDDITDRRRAEEELRESEARFRSLFENNHAVMLLVDTETGCIVDANPAAVTYYGYTREQLQAMQIWDINMLPRDEVLARMARAQTEQQRRFQFQHRKAGGEICDVEVFAGPITIGKQTLLYSIVHDITRRVRAERERERLLHEVEDRAAELDATINSIADGLIIYAPDGQILRINAAARRILAYQAEVWNLNVVERTTTLLPETAEGQPFPPENIPAVRALQGETVQSEIMVLHQAQQLRRVSVSAAPIRTPDGRLLGAVITLADITRLHELEQQRELYTHTISHDLRAPLTAIQGHAQLLRETLIADAQDAQQLASVEAILRGAQRMNVMIQDLVDVARAEGRKLTLQIQSVGLSDYLADLLQRFSMAIEVTRIHIDLPPDLPPVAADYDRLERIFMNLLTNALKYSAPETSVYITAQRQNGEVVVSIRDAGEGISPEDLPHLFERFYRAKGPRKTEGIGLGLFITRTLIEAHGGHIRVESKVGTGSTFYFTLPVA